MADHDVERVCIWNTVNMCRNGPRKAAEDFDPVNWSTSEK